MKALVIGAGFTLSCLGACTNGSQEHSALATASPHSAATAIPLGTYKAVQGDFETSCGTVTISRLGTQFPGLSADVRNGGAPVVLKLPTLGVVSPPAGFDTRTIEQFKPASHDLCFRITDAIASHDPSDEGLTQESSICFHSSTAILRVTLPAPGVEALDCSYTNANSSANNAASNDSPAAGDSGESASVVANPECQSQAIAQSQDFAMDDGDEACAGNIKVNIIGKVTAPSANVERYHTTANCGVGTSFRYTFAFDASKSCSPLTQGS
jgi:hypothetical protein